MIIPHSNKKEGHLPGKDPLSIFIVGSTGSIGRSTLEIVRNFPERFRVSALVAGGNSKELIAQANEFRPDFIGVSDAEKGGELNGHSGCNTGIGDNEILKRVSEGKYDILVAAASGFAGLESVLAALQAGKRVALANKESLVAGGKLVASLIKKNRGVIIPVDSEHSAIFQAIQGSDREEISTITLTASGGPFLTTPLNELQGVTPAQAIRHPKWSMGRKISVDSATMFNKGLELIEAHWLFEISSERIEIVVHPQSILHSMVNFRDGSSLAQLSVPDMKGAISYALNYPADRLEKVVPALKLEEHSPLEFIKLDESRFRAIPLARAALERGGAAPAVYNAANEMAVGMFLDGNLRFDLIPEAVAYSLEQFGSLDYSTLEELREIDRSVRDYVASKMRMN